MGMQGLGSSKAKGTPVGTPEPTRTHGLAGGKAGGAHVDSARTQSGGPSKLAVGSLKAKRP